MDNHIPSLPGTLVMPEKTLTGRGIAASLLVECRRFGPRGVLIHGSALEQGHRRQTLLANTPEDLSLCVVRHQGGEPTLGQVSALIECARHHQAGWIAGVGGGSVLDLAKAAAALINAPHPPAHYHNGAALPETGGAVFIAVPTTAGTGTEATLNSVLTNEATQTKKSIRAPGMMARLVLLDADLLADCRKPVIAASGMDALTQAIEAYTSRNATWLSDTLALQAIRLVSAHLEAVHRDSRSPEAEPLLVGSYLAGVALSFARLGIVHGLAHPLGTLYGQPHGVVCAACLPWAMELNRAAMGAKYDAIGGAMGGDPIRAVRTLLQRLELANPFAGQPLRESGMIIREALASGSTQASPKSITRADVEWMLEQVFASGHG
jgi:alcohol dehydrogenase class IV